MLACAALVACTNDDIVENDVNNPQIGELENVPAYITVSIGTSNSSSRATVNGDADGDAENSGHENEGTKDENKINNIAVIIKTLTADGGNASNSGVATIMGSDDFTETTVTEGETILAVKSPFKVLAGTHKVLTIINPTDAIQTAVGNAKDYEAIGELYDKLAGDAVLSEYGLTYDAIGNCADGIMFLNRDEVTVEAKSTNSETSPAVATIMLERPVAKLMYRGTTADNTYPITITITKQEYNVVKVNNVTYALVKDAADRIRAVEATNVKYTTDGKKVTDLSLMKTADGVFKCYTYNNETEAVGTELMNPEELKGTPGAIPDNYYYLLKDKNGDWVAPECIFTPYTEQLGGENGGWNVKLTQYALINLINKSYVIRHTANELGTDVNTFGLLTGKNYIADPYFKEKNKAATDNGFTNVDAWETTDWTKWNEAAKGWFKNTLKDVADETAGVVPTTSYFKNLTSTVIDGKHDPKQVGDLLQYCFENGVMSHNQLHGLTTGIVFKGEVVGKGDLPTMYQYGTEVYIGLDDIIKAYGSGNKAIAALKDLENVTSDESKKAIKDAGIKIYANQECYYYTNQIKHFDNGDNNVAGNMEFAIVRNNIYSLAVTDIKGIGDAAIDPNPGIENESSVGYIKVEAERIPWIVRFNDIEF
ncbi:fimbria major subunit [Phocaeicola sp.]